jgi:signal transduction histidine kinase
MTAVDNWEFMKSNWWSHLGVRFGIAFILLGANAWVAYQAADNLIDAEHSVAHTAEILREVESDISLAKDIETATRGYVITANPEFLEPYYGAQRKVKDKLEPLLTMTRDNPTQQKRVTELSELINRKLELAREQIDLVNSGRKAEAAQIVARGGDKAIMDAVRAKAGEMRAAEEQLLATRQASLKQAGTRAKWTIWLAMGFGLVLMSVIFSSMVSARLQSVELSKALHDLKRLEAMRDGLNAMLVHDLRTPLTTILAPLEMLQLGQFGQLQETQREIIGMSLSSSRRLLGLINELLDVSKMEAGEMKLRRESLRPQVVIDEALKHIALAKYGGTARIDLEVPEDLPLLQADQELLTRILINLLGNATKFTPSSGTISLGLSECVPLEVLPSRLKSTFEQSSTDHLSVQSLLFCVGDSGEGIPAEELDRIFEKFGQVESREAGRNMSTGLGLTFCKLAVEAHGGVIWAESEFGHGSTFYFTIPLRAVAPSEEDQKKGEAAVALQ